MRGPLHSVCKGKTLILAAEKARAMLDAIEVSKVVGLRDCTLVGLMVLHITCVRLHEKGGKVHEMPCHHDMGEYAHAYLQTAALETDLQGYLFRSAKRRLGKPSSTATSQADVYQMISRRAVVARSIPRSSAAFSKLSGSLNNCGIASN